MPDNSSEVNKELQKVNTREFIDISKWAFLISFKLDAYHTVVYLLSSIVINFRDIVDSFIFAKLLDILIKISQRTDARISDLYPYLALLISYELFSSLLGYINRYSNNALRNITRPKIRQAFYERLNLLGIQSLEQPEINNKIYRADSYLSEVIPYSRDLTDFISSVIKSIGSIILVYSFFPLYIPLMIFAIVPYVLFDKRYRTLSYKFIFENTEGSRRASYYASDLVNPVKLQEISITRTYNYFDKKYKEFYERYTKEHLKIIKRWMGGNRSFSFLTDLVRFAGSIKIFAQLLARRITIGDVTFQTRTLGIAQASLMSIFSGLNDLFESSLYLRDAYLIFTTDPKFADGTKELPKLSQGPDIRFMNVSFKYPNSEKLVIENLNLKINSGEKVAIVGHNGAGKTTLVKLISRIYPVTNGEILINGNNLDEININSLYKNMGVLFQDFNVYSQLTARENILVGNSEEAEDETAIRLAAQAADAIEFIEEYPKGFDQILGERFKGGIRPSSGQWQKLAIARFFYRNAPLVIFDEPTASIDAVSEYNIFNKIYDFFKNKTVIIISHRFSTVRNADRIIVLEKGKIIEEGTHEHLMSLNGKYAEAFLLQAKGYANVSS